MTTILRLLLCSVLVFFSTSSFSDQIKKKYTDNRYLVEFTDYEPSSGDVIPVLGTDGSEVGTLKLKSVKGKRGIGYAETGADRLRVGLKVSAPSEGSSGSAESGSKADSSLWFMGLNVGYTIPGFTYMANTLNYGFEFGKGFSQSFSGFLDVNSFSTSGYRFVLASFNAQYKIAESVPIVLTGGVGASIVLTTGKNLYDPMVPFSGGYEIAFSESFSLTPKVWGAYVFGVTALVDYQMFQLGVTARLRF
jgi:hypothetical protein